MRLLAEELGHFLDHHRHPGLAADEDHLVDVALGQPGVLQRLLTGLQRPLDQITHQALQLGAGQLHYQVQRRSAVLVHADERLVDLGLAGRGQLDLGLFGGFLQPLQGHLVLGQIDAVLLLELVGEILDHLHVEVLAAEERVPVGRFHLEQAVVDFQDGDVEGAAAEVIDRDRLAVLLVQTVGEGRSRRFVDDPQHVEAGDLAGVLGRLTLGVVEIGGHRDDGLRHRFAQVAFGGFLHLLKDHGADLRRAVLVAPDLDPGVAVAAVHDAVGDQLAVLLDLGIGHAAADQALDGEDGVFRVGDGLALGRLADEPLALGEGDDGRRGARALCVLDDAGLAAVHDGDAAVGGPEVDADDFGHAIYLSCGDGAGCGSVRGPRAPIPSVMLGRGAAPAGFATLYRRRFRPCKPRSPPLPRGFYP